MMRKYVGSFQARIPSYEPHTAEAFRSIPPPLPPPLTKEAIVIWPPWPEAYF